MVPIPPGDGRLEIGSKIPLVLIKILTSF